MGWAKDAFERELANSRILPVNNSYGGGYDSPPPRKPRKKILRYYNYDFPTEAQVRALNFITTYTGVVFEGTTKMEAREFINEYIDYAKEEKDNE